MTPDELAAIEARANAATNWISERGLSGMFPVLEDVPALIAEVRRLQAQAPAAPSWVTPMVRVAAQPMMMQLDPPLTVEANEMLYWAADGSKVGRYRQDDAGEWRLIEQREVQP